MTTDKLKSDIVFKSELGGHELILHSTWGLFSPKAIDEGTALLMQYLTVASSDVVLDLGCGYGPLGLAIAKMAPEGLVHLVDKDFVAIEFTQKNINLNHIGNAQAYLSNGFEHVPPDLKFDVIVSNVPAKIGSELLSIFLNDAYDRLNPGGKLYIVTISGLKEYMKRNLTNVFGNYEKLKQSKTYTAALSVKNQNSKSVTAEII